MMSQMAVGLGERARLLRAMGATERRALFVAYGRSVQKLVQRLADYCFPKSGLQPWALSVPFLGMLSLMLGCLVGTAIAVWRQLVHPLSHFNILQLISEEEKRWLMLIIEPVENIRTACVCMPWFWHFHLWHGVCSVLINIRNEGDGVNREVMPVVLATLLASFTHNRNFVYSLERSSLFTLHQHSVFSSRLWASSYFLPASFGIQKSN